MTNPEVCPACGQKITGRKGGLLMPVLTGISLGVLVAVVFNNYYFAGSGFWDIMPLTHLISGFLIGAVGGLVAGVTMRNRRT